MHSAHPHTSIIKDGASALDLASQRFRVDVVDELIRLGADTSSSRVLLCTRHTLRLSQPPSLLLQPPKRRRVVDSAPAPSLTSTFKSDAAGGAGGAATGTGAVGVGSAASAAGAPPISASEGAAGATISVEKVSDVHLCESSLPCVCLCVLC
jgi:hypothetical protein